jgi:hypothetical protein
VFSVGAVNFFQVQNNSNYKEQACKDDQSCVNLNHFSSILESSFSLQTHKAYIYSSRICNTESVGEVAHIFRHVEVTNTFTRAN